MAVSQSGGQWVLAASLVVSGLAGCEGQSLAAEPEAVAATVQQLRTAQGTTGQAFVGLDLLATGKSGKPLACDQGALSVEAAFSLDGPDGPFVDLPAESVHVSCGDAAGDFALVVDNSGSEEGWLPQLKHAARDVVHRVLDLGGRASLVRVSTEARVTQALTGDRPTLEHALNDLYVSNGWTALYDGVRMANETLGSGAQAAAPTAYDDADVFCRASAKLGIVAITDGRENNSSGQRLQDAEYPGDGLDTSAEDLGNLRVDGITTPIYTIGLGDEVEHAALTAIAERSGGRHLQIAGGDDIAAAFDVIATYAESRHQVCTSLPVDACGPLHMRVRYRYEPSAGKGGKKAQAVEGEQAYRLDVPCPAPAEAAQSTGRIATVLMAISGMQLPDAERARLVTQTVDAVSPVAAPRVLVVLDDNHHGEHPGDTAEVVAFLQAAGYAVTYADEPAAGLAMAQLDGFDVVWLANPGYPVDDAATVEHLLSFARAGGGVVLQGDDMTMAYGNAFSMRDATGLEHLDNGISYCGNTINNGHGRYEVTMTESSDPLVGALAGRVFDYTDDMDTTRAPENGATVLAWAIPPNSAGCHPKPAIVIHTPE